MSSGSSSGGSGSSSGVIADAGCVVGYGNYAPPISETDDTSQSLPLPTTAGGTIPSGNFNLTSYQFYQGSTGYTAGAMIAVQLTLQVSDPTNGSFVLVDGGDSTNGTVNISGGQIVLTPNAGCPSTLPTGDLDFSFAGNVLTMVSQTANTWEVFTVQQ